MKRTLICILLGCLTLCLCAASAESLTLTGTVMPGESVPVYAPIGGTVGTVNVEAGQQVSADDILYTMKTSKVYAQEDGTVTGIFGQPGDSADTVAERYGAVLYLEGNSVFSISASTDNAYNSTETKFVHVGEKVYLLCRTSNARTGEGTITAVSGTSYTVQVDSGTFIPGDSVDIYRDEAHTNALKIGRGNISRVSPTAVTASGSIVRIAVSNGDQVKRGDLLLETLDGSFDGLYMSGTEIPAGQAGIIGSLNAAQGSSIQKDSIAAVIYPLNTVRVEAYVPEDSRSLIQEGETVTIELEADESKTYQGTVTLVSSVAENGEGETTYRVLVDFVPDDVVRFGMSVVISTGEDETADAETLPTEDTDTAELTEKDDSSSDNTETHDRGERPEGFPERPEGERPEGFSGRPDGEKSENASGNSDDVSTEVENESQSQP